MYKKTTLSIKVIGFLFVLLTQTLKAQIINQAPSVSPTAICGTGTATVTLPSSEIGVTYALTNGVAIIGTPVSGTGNSISFPTGTLTVTTTFIVAATNGTSTVTMNPAVTVTVNALPTVSISPSHTAICKGAVDTLTASGAVNYTWSPGGTTASSETVAPTNTNTPTAYTLTGTDANGCTNTSTISITVNAVPTINITSSTGGGPTSICPGATLTLTASGGVTYNWLNNSATTNSITISPTATTQYTVVGTNSVGCTGTRTKTVTVNPTATVTISGPAFICNGSAGTLTAGGSTTYTWSTNATTTSISVSPTVTTTYSVVSGTGFGTCPGTASFTLNVTANPPPTVSISGSSSVCAGQSDLLTASGASTYTWNTGATTNTISPTPGGNTTYTVTGTDASGCTNTSTLSVTVNPLPTLTITGTKTICDGSATTLTVSGASSYTWSTGDLTATAALSPTVTTSYSVTGTNANGCSKQSVTTVTVKQFHH